MKAIRLSDRRITAAAASTAPHDVARSGWKKLNDDVLLAGPRVEAFSSVKAALNNGFRPMKLKKATIIRSCWLQAR